MSSIPPPAGAAPAAPVGTEMVRFGGKPVSADARKVLGLDDDPTAPTPPPQAHNLPVDSTGAGTGVGQADIPTERSCVDSMPLVIQRGFRFKMLGLLVLQLFFIFIGSVVLVKLEWTVPQDIFTLCFLGMGTCLLAMWMLKNRYPLNYFLYLVFTLLATTFLGAGSNYFRSSANFQILGYTLVNVAVLFQISLRTQKNESGEDEMIDWSRAYQWAWAAMILVALPVQIMITPGPWGHFFTSVLFATMFTFWFRYDAEKMCACLSPDDYMMGFLSMWADFFSVIAICVTMCCLCGDGGGGDGGGDFSAAEGAHSATV